MKRIVFLITDCDFGGAEQVLFELCQALHKEFSIDVLILKQKGYFARRIEELGLKVKSYGLGKKVNLIYLLKLPLIFIRLCWELKKIKPEIIQGILFQANLFAKLSGWLCSVPYIFCAVHTFDQGRIKRFLERLSFKLAEVYIVVSAGLREFCIKNFAIPEEKILVIRNGVQLNLSFSSSSELRKSLKLKDSNLVIGAIARLHREKGIDLLIRAFQALAKEFPELILVIVGDGEERENLEALVKNSGLEDRVIFTGFQEAPERYLDVFEIFVLPSRVEAMPITLLQAMSLGKAIVATKVGGIPELIEDSQEGLLVEAEDQFLMTRAISRLVKDQNLRKVLGEKAEARAIQEFGLEKMISSYRELYLGYLEGKK